MKRSKTILVLFFAMLTANVFAQDYKLEGSEVKIDVAVQFKPATATLLPGSDAALNIIKRYLDDKTYISLLRVEGHTDDAGQTLSEDRALAVCKRLVELGVDCKRLIAVGFGNQKPVADNSTAEGRLANRRISFVNVALRGHNIGGLPEDGGGKVAKGEICKLQ